MNKLERLEQVSKEGLQTAKYLAIKVDEVADISKIKALLEESKEGRLNIRTYKEGIDKGCPFVYGLRDIKEIKGKLKEIQGRGYNVILNETIDENDGGVSGVALGNIMEFGPFGTVRSVIEDGDTCILPTGIAIKMFGTVYGLQEKDLDMLYRIYKLSFVRNCRVEFSIHPVGNKVIVWDIEKLEGDTFTELDIDLSNSNKFSRMLGEKVYNLLLIRTQNIELPKTRVINRYITGIGEFRLDSSKEEFEREVWTRTSPTTKMAGKYITEKGNIDPKELFNEFMPSVMYQEDQPVDWAGSAIRRSKNLTVIEGVEGYGDKFQIGEQAPTILPIKIRTIIEDYIERIGKVLERQFKIEELQFSIEWGVIGDKPVLFQINFVKDEGRGLTIVPKKTNDPMEYEEFHTARGLPELREFLSKEPVPKGVKLVGNIGITSHFCDILRESDIPSFLVRE